VLGGDEECRVRRLGGVLPRLRRCIIPYDGLLIDRSVRASPLHAKAAADSPCSRRALEYNH
jgi:hypothetical protein